jgi:hypothetical protein
MNQISEGNPPQKKHQLRLLLLSASKKLISIELKILHVLVVCAKSDITARQ